jgi:hypothetical protein
MVLSPKRTYTLQTLLSAINPADAEVFCTHAGIQTANINFRQTARQVWEEILNQVLQDQKTSLALLAEIRKGHDSAELRNFYNEILDGRQNRLKKLAEALKRGKCVVFLGPEVLKVRDNNNIVPFNDLLSRELSGLMSQKSIYFDRSLSGNISYLAQCFTDYPAADDHEVASIAARKYNEYLEQELLDDDIHEQLAKLPLRLVVNANPDDLLCKQLNDAAPDTCVLRFLDTSNSDMTVESTANGQPAPGANPAYKVIQYNIFGIFNRPESILYTEIQFLNFIRTVLGSKVLDADVSSELEIQENYLFLGFDFDQWYFKVLFEYFKVKKVDYACVSCGFQQPPVAGAPMRGISSYNREFFEQEFKMFFVNDDIKRFLVDLRNTLKAIS